MKPGPMDALTFADWLEKAIFTGTYEPLTVPHSIGLSVFLVDYLSDHALRIEVAADSAIVRLVRMHMRGQDPARLHELLRVISALRVVDSEQWVVRVLRQSLRTGEEDDETALLCLQALSSLGLTKHSANTVRNCLAMPTLAATAYRALYKHSTSYAGSDFPRLAATFSDTYQRARLAAAVRLFARSHATYDECVDFVRQVMSRTPKSRIASHLGVFHEAGLHVDPVLRSPGRDVLRVTTDFHRASREEIVSNFIDLGHANRRTLTLFLQSSRVYWEANVPDLAA